MDDTKTPAPASESTMRVFNRMDRRSFLHESFVLAPRAFLDVPLSVAQKWLKEYPNDIVEAGIAQKELTGVQTELAETKAAVAKKDAELVALKAQLAALQPKGKRGIDQV